MNDIFEEPVHRLNEEIVRRVFPVARSDRRENQDLFRRWLSAEDLRHDDRFYPALVQILAEDIELLREYDRRVVARRKPEKSFGSRIYRQILQSLQEDIDTVEIINLPDSHFPAFSLERTLHQLLRRLVADDATPPQTEESTQDVSPKRDWKVVGEEISSAVSAMGDPNLVQASIILALAQELRSICKDLEEATSLEANTNERRQALIERLSPLASVPKVAELLANLPSAAADVLERLESATSQLPEFWQKLNSAELIFDQIKRERTAAVANDDLDRLDELAAPQRQARASLDEARLTFAETLSHVSTLVDSLPDFNVGTITVEHHLDGSGGFEKAIAEESHASNRDELEFDQDQESDLLDASQANDPSPAVSFEAEGDLVVAGLKRGSAPADELVEPHDTAVEGYATSLQEREQISAAVSSGLDDLLTIYLERNEVALAWHLADLSEERGEQPAVPAAVLKALAIYPAIARPGDVASASTQDILAEAMSCVEEIEREGNEVRADRARTLFFSALLRPALFDLGQSARAHLANLAMRGSIAEFAPLGAALGGLGYDVQLSAEDLVDLTGVERKHHLPAVTTRLREWLDRARVAKTMHQPTYRILHWLLASNGELGRVFEAVLANAPGAQTAAKTLLDRLLDDRSEQERFIAEWEKNSGRPRRDRIEGMALDWFCKNLQEGCEVLREWMAAREADAAQVDDRHRSNLQAIIGQLRKLTETQKSVGNTYSRDLDAVVRPSSSA
jgi:hypothetical protein